MSEEQEPTGRAAVRAHLIDPLNKGGMVRPKRMTVTDHEAELKELLDGLSHMKPADLDGLRKLVISHAEANPVPHWPRAAAILNWAWRTHPPPPRDNSYVISVLRSALGRRARDEGWLVEFFVDARRFGPPPPGEYSISRLKERAERNERQCNRIRQRIEEGSARAVDHQWLEGYHAARAEAESIMDADEAGCAA